jgi:hypothetical protein
MRTEPALQAMVLARDAARKPLGGVISSDEK